MGRKFHPQILRDGTEPELAVKHADPIHIDKLRVREIETEGGQRKPFRLEIVIFDVVHRGVPRRQSGGILQKRADTRLHLGKGGVFFEILIFVRQYQPLRALAVGEVKAALRIDEDIFLFEDMKILVRKTIPERADLGGVFEYAGAFDVEK